MDKAKYRATQILICDPNVNQASSKKIIAPGNGKRRDRTESPEQTTSDDIIHLPRKRKLRKKIHTTDSKESQYLESTGKFEGADSRNYLETKPGLPWGAYEIAFQRQDLGGNVELAVEKASARFVNIRVFPSEAAEETLYWIRQIRNESFVTALETFTTNDFLYIVLEEMQITLSRVISCSRYPTQHQLGAILGQILDGLAYLETEGFEYTTLTWETILLNSKGEVKIGYQEFCRKATHENKSWAIKKIRLIANGLLHKDTRDPQPVGVQRSEWLSCDDVLEFVAATTSARSAKELLKHEFFVSNGRKFQEWDKQSLMALVALADIQSYPREYYYRDGIDSNHM
ncbi:hypothetical protein BX600DRAFT_440095 [Xylariales sp. PMI_506]|nr:hypothetical protein BX600DRAFT_440095 [Xylariales sp. PMI_506]